MEMNEKNMINILHQNIKIKNLILSQNQNQFTNAPLHSQQNKFQGNHSFYQGQQVQMNNQQVSQINNSFQTPQTNSNFFTEQQFQANFSDTLIPNGPASNQLNNSVKPARPAPIPNRSHMP